MEITVNGRRQEINSGLSLMEYLLERGYDKTRIAVELNGEIIPKAKYKECRLNEHDKLEVVTFVGGG